MEGKLRHTPTWRAKCRISGSRRPLRFELWGARGDYAFYLTVLQRSRLLKELHKRHKVYTGSGHRCGVTLLQCVVGGLPLGADDDEQYKEEQPREGLLWAGAMNCKEEFSHPSLSFSLIFIPSPHCLALTRRPPYSLISIRCLFQMPLPWGWLVLFIGKGPGPLPKY